jgi:hypothetical protein
VHGLVIAVHATAGLVALLAGGISLRRRGTLPLYFSSLVACIAVVALAVILDWHGLSTTTRLRCTALLALGA